MLLFGAAAVAGGWWNRTAIGFGGWPSGAIADTRLQYRAPLHRSRSILFRETYAGIGGRLALTPTYADVGPRLSLAPIDIFDVDLQASFVGYWPTRYGPLPFDELRGTLEADRGARSDQAFSTWALALTVAPTLKLKAGPLVAIDTWTITRWQIARPADVDAPWMYEPYTDLLLSFADTTVEHQAMLLLTAVPGDDGGARLWLGPTYRDRRALSSGDRSAVLGGVAWFRLGKAGWLPQGVVQVLPYLVDGDRVGGAPNAQAQLYWVIDGS